MPRSTLGLAPSLETYLSQHSPQHPVLEELARVTAPMEGAGMQIAPNQASFMAWLVGTLGARRCIEVGVFTGYSSLVTALALPDDGSILACDVSEEWTAIARDHWAKAKVDHKIELVLAPAIETLQSRLTQGKGGSFDFAFIDADKEQYLEYYRLCLELLRPSGVVVFDNTLWGGSVASPEDVRETTCAIRRLNDAVLEDPRVTSSLVPVGDGLLLVTKK